MYKETHNSVLKVFLENIIKDAVTNAKHAKRKTVKSIAMAIVYASKCQGHTM
jgi:histone H3/H4